MALVHDDRPQRSTARRSLCAVVPTRNEAGNVRQVVTRLGQALAGIPSEILFVDDSDDETPVGRATNWPTASGSRGSACCTAPVPSASGGLGSAVVAGLRHADADWVCVLDGDLQHPPEVVPELLAVAEQSGADLVIATRYAGDGPAPTVSASAGASSPAAPPAPPGRCSPSACGG